MDRDDEDKFCITYSWPCKNIKSFLAPFKFLKSARKCLWYKCESRPATNHDRQFPNRPISLIFASSKEFKSCLFCCWTFTALVTEKELWITPDDPLKIWSNRIKCMWCSHYPCNSIFVSSLQNNSLVYFWSLHLSKSGLLSRFFEFCQGCYSNWYCPLLTHFGNHQLKFLMIIGNYSDFT